MPTPMRQAAKTPKDRAKPDRAVMALQNAKPVAIRLRRDQTSAKRASGMPNTA